LAILSRLAQALDQDAHEGLVEADLAGVGGGAQGVGLDPMAVMDSVAMMVVVRLLVSPVK